ncbi:MAG: alkaline phosphatase D family protein [Verrucomicrobiota bacterium]
MLACYHRSLLLVTVTLLAVFSSLNAAKIVAGPMVGAPEMRAISLWVQTDAPAKVSFAYWPKGYPGQRNQTPTVETQQANGFVAEAAAAPLVPGTTYEYSVVINGTAVQSDHATEFSTTPFFTDRAPPPDFTIALGSDNRVNDELYDPLNRSPGDGYDIFLAILAKDPAFMLWAGDAVNLREPDWGSREGMIERYSFNRKQPELQPLLAKVPQVAAFSQGEFGPTNNGKHFNNLGSAQEVFDLFWANPSSPQSVDGMATVVRYGDAEFYILDDRTNRDLDHTVPKQKKVFGDEQLEWLRRSLRQSDATFKVVVSGTPALSPVEIPRNLRMAKPEQERMIDKLKDDKIEGLIFVAGGKDFGEFTKMVRANAPDLYELTLGPLTDRPAEKTRELNFYRVPSTSTFTRQFATMRFHGAEGDRQITISVFNTLGGQLWTQTIPRSQMRFN